VWPGRAAAPQATRPRHTGFASSFPPLRSFPPLHPLPPPQVIPYNQRIALLLFKLQAATFALSRLDHAAALGYALSMAHDAAGLHVAVRGARKGLALELTCLGAEKRRRWWAVPGGAGVVCFALIAWRVARGRGGGGGRDKSHLF
jgi:hypothetical protein